jgi:tetratricopeptide (TPR) repeat protein
MDNLGLAYRDSGKIEQALPLLEEVLKLRKTTLGLDSARTLDSMNILAETFVMAGNYTQAETVYREALSQLRLPSSNAAPREIPLLGIILHHLADVLRERQTLIEARSFAEQAMAVYERHGNWPPNERAHAFSVLEAILKKLGDSRALRSVRLKHVEALRPAAENGDVAASNSLAWFLATCSDSAIRDGRSAVNFAEKAVAKTERKFPEHLDTLAAAYAETGEFEKALNVQNEAIALLHEEAKKRDYESRLKLYQGNSPYREP